MYAIYGVPWIPSIYLLYVSINIPAPWIRMKKWPFWWLPGSEKLPALHRHLAAAQATAALRQEPSPARGW